MAEIAGRCIELVAQIRGSVRMRVGFNDLMRQRRKGRKFREPSGGCSLNLVLPLARNPCGLGTA